MTEMIEIPKDLKSLYERVHDFSCGYTGRDDVKILIERISRAEQRVKELEQENARLKAPVSDAEWAQCYWTSETGLRGLVGSFLAARAAQKGTEHA